MRRCRPERAWLEGEGVVKPVLLLALSLAVGVATTIAAARAQELTGAAAVTGASSTFAFPIISRWARGYQKWVAGGGDIPIAGSGLDDPPAGPVLDYEPSGSLAGTMRLRAGAVDFGASDVPLKSDELHKLGLVQFPIVIGGVVAVTNLDGVGPGELKLTGEVLSNIYLGSIQNWSDPAIKTLNPAIKLPEAKIGLVHRSDGSGTTYNFTSYLSQVSPRWRGTVGADLLVKWPSGTGAKGNDGVSRAVRQSRNAIGYVEYSHAVQTRLSYAALQNRAGQFVVPAPARFQAAAASAEWGRSSDFDMLIIDAPGADSYPLVVTVFVQMQRALAPARMRDTLNFLRWSLDRGAKDATELGYVPLPDGLIAQIKRYWAANLKAGS